MTPHTPPADGWTERLWDYLDEELSDRDRDECQRHLAQCAACSSRLRELGALRARARDWNRPMEPARDLWSGIEARLEPRRKRWSWPHLSFGGAWRMPKWAAAAALIALVVAGAWWLRPAPAPEFVAGNHQPVAETGPTPPPAPSERVAAGPPEAAPMPPLPETDEVYLRRVSRLQREAADRLARDPRLVEVLDDNLATIDMAIATYREALTREPGDPALRRRIEEARRRKISLLERAVALSTAGAN